MVICFVLPAPTISGQVPTRLARGYRASWGLHVPQARECSDDQLDMVLKHITCTPYWTVSVGYLDFVCICFYRLTVPSRQDGEIDRGVLRGTPGLH